LGWCHDKCRPGEKPKLGPISKQGERYLRRILVVGAVSTLRCAKLNPQRYPWVTRLLARRPFKVVAVALASKMARIARALRGRSSVDSLIAAKRQMSGMSRLALSVAMRAVQI
jgi:hypothetical protein